MNDKFKSKCLFAIQCVVMKNMKSHSHTAYLCITEETENEIFGKIKM